MIGLWATMGAAYGFIGLILAAIIFTIFVVAVRWKQFKAIMQQIETLLWGAPLDALTKKDLKKRRFKIVWKKKKERSD